MKKIVENLYLFSRLTLTFSLFICLIGVLYILYINYKKEDSTYANQKVVDQRLQSAINNNLKLINQISDEIKLNEDLLLDIKENIKNIKEKNNKEEISIINQSIQNLNNNIDMLSNEIKNLKNDQVSTILKDTNRNNNIIENANAEIIDLILLKYENNLSFNEELEYLKNRFDSTKQNKIDKILILSLEPFKGFDYLERVFDEELSLYLKDVINTNPESIFSKIILPYLEVSPTSENTITSDLILKIKKIKFNIENKNIKKSIDDLKTIKEYEKNFNLTFLEINKYLSFKSILLSLK